MICHLVYYLEAFIADRVAKSGWHQWENLQIPPSQFLPGSRYMKEKGNPSTSASSFTQRILLQCWPLPRLTRMSIWNISFLCLFTSSHHYNSRSLSSLLCIWFWCHWMPGFRKEQINSCGTLPNDSFTLYFRDWHKQKKFWRLSSMKYIAIWM